MALHGHLGAVCTPELAKALKSSRLWDEAATFAWHMAELDKVLRSWAYHAPADLAGSYRTERPSPSTHAGEPSREPLQCSGLLFDGLK